MIFLYTFLLLFLGAVKMLIDRRVRGLEKKYFKTAQVADQMAREPLLKGGNTRLDPCVMAKRQYLLGHLVQKRDRLETRHASWLAFSKKFTDWLDRLRSWKGKKLPYTLGAIDVSCVMGLVDWFGAGQYVSLRYLIQQITTLISR